MKFVLKYLLLLILMHLWHIFRKMVKFASERWEAMLHGYRQADMDTRR